MKAILLVIPVLILGFGIYLLLNKENKITKKEASIVSLDSTSITRKDTIGNKDTTTSIVENIYKYQVLQPENTYAEDLKNSRDAAYKFILLGSGLLVVLLILPRISSLTLSPTSLAITTISDAVVEVANDVHSAADNLQATTSETIRASSLESTNPQVLETNKKLNELKISNEKLKVYTDLLKKIAEAREKTGFFGRK